MSSHGHSDDGHDFAHPMPVPMLLAVFGILTFLTIITVAQASFDLSSFGNLDVTIVMIIATIKATLVGAFFMHLAHDKPFNVLVFVGSFIFVGLFVIFTIGDSQMTSKDTIPVDGVKGSLVLGQPPE